MNNEITQSLADYHADKEGYHLAISHDEADVIATSVLKLCVKLGIATYSADSNGTDVLHVYNFESVTEEPSFRLPPNTILTRETMVILLEDVQRIKTEFSTKEYMFLCNGSDTFYRLWMSRYMLIKKVGREFLQSIGQSENYRTDRGTIFNPISGRGVLPDDRELRIQFLDWWIQKLESAPN